MKLNVSHARARRRLYALLGLLALSSTATGLWNWQKKNTDGGPGPNAALTADPTVAAPVPVSARPTPIASTATARAQARSPHDASASLGSSSEGLEQIEVFERQSLGLLKAAPDLRRAGAREELVTRLAELETRQKEALERHAGERSVPLRRATSATEHEALIGFDGARPVYMASQNKEAAVTTAASFVRQNSTFDSTFGPSIDGGDFSAGVFELYTINPNHEEFLRADSTSRVEVLDTGGSGQHATHVAGTIGAEGKDPDLKGMAPAVTLLSWVQESASKYASRAIPYPGDGNMVITNTSLASTGDGRYTAADQARDEWALLFPYTIMFQCVGNTDGDYTSLLGVSKEAKNHMVVGNVVSVSRNSSGAITGSTYIIGSSARGPTDDGRIKPDVIADGYFVKSTANDTTGSVTLSGTSMATPNAAGSAILLQDYFSKRFPGHLMRSDTLKALISHTADDRGTAGPDYTWGFGIMNTLAAAKVIKAYADNPACQRIIHAELPASGEHTYSFTWDGTSPIKVALAWIDPVGPASAYDDDRTPALVNDLDVTVVAPSSTVHYPWTMPYVVNGFNPSDFATAAVRGVNTVDNIETLLIGAPSESGVYTIKVRHTGTLSGGSQAYSLVHSGFVAPAAAPAPTVTGWTDLGDGWVEITGAHFLLGAEATRVYGDTITVPGEHMQVSATRIVCRFASSPFATGELVVTNPDSQSAGVTLPLPALTGGIELTAYASSRTYTQNFDSLTTTTSTSQTWVNDSPTDTANGLKGWHAGYFLANGSASATAAVIRADAGGTDYARLYSYGSSGSSDRAFGNFRKDDVVPYQGSVRQGVRLVNRTGRTLTGFSLAFKGEQWRKAGNTVQNSMQVSYAVFPADEGTLLDGAVAYTSLVNFVAPIKGGSAGALDGNATGNFAPVSASVSALVWAPGEELWVRWLTPNHAYVDDGLAIDDLTITAWPASGP